MPEKIKLTPSNGLKITYKGVFELNNLLSSMKSFLKKRKYEYQEKEYSESSPSPGELKIVWEATKDIDDFYKYEITVDILFEKLEPIKTQDEVKQYAEITMKIHANIILDRKRKWEESLIKNKLFPLYKGIIKARTDEHSLELKEEARNLQNIAKKIFALYN